MFWFAFISIILFIIFLITILISMGRSTTDKNFRSLKEELEEKNRKFHEKKVSSKKEKKKPKPEPVAETLPPVVEEKSVEVVVEETPSVATEVEIPVTLTAETPLSNVVEPEEAEAEAEPQTQEEPPEAFIEEVLEETPTVTQEDEQVVVEQEEETPEVVLEELPSAAPEPEHLIEDVLEEAPPTVEEVVPDDYDYPAFDNTRTMEEFGLSKEEADDFIVDLIQQIEDEMPSLITAVETGDSKQIEDISHMIKGSATNLGTGGVADVLIEFNTYMKTDNDPKVIAKHMRHLDRALKELKEQFQ